MGCKFAAEPGQIESSVDLPHQTVFRDRVAKMKLVEELTLVTSDGPSWINLDSRQHNGITRRGVSQPAFATKTAKSGRFRKNSDLTP